MVQLTDPIYVLGLSIITSNEDAFKNNSIGKLWNQFIHSALKDKLKNLSSSNIFVVYSDYEDAHHGQYSVTIGYAVKELTTVPNALSTKIIQKGKYQPFLVESQTPEAIVKTWKSIWETDSHTLVRNYQTDYEEYSEKDVTIYIGAC
jgi:predicted transcriptional regulator YdeE